MLSLALLGAAWLGGFLHNLPAYYDWAFLVSFWYGFVTFVVPSLLIGFDDVF